MSETTRAELLAHPENYIIRSWDVMHRQFVERSAAECRREDLQSLDLRLVHLLPVKKHA